LSVYLNFYRKPEKMTKFFLKKKFYLKFLKLAKFWNFPKIMVNRQSITLTKTIQKLQIIWKNLAYYGKNRIKIRRAITKWKTGADFWDTLYLCYPKTLHMLATHSCSLVWPVWDNAFIENFQLRKNMIFFICSYFF